MSKPTKRDCAIAEAISDWFIENDRDFPWRTTPRNPYYALVSEAMLLQTQAARIAERFPVFIDRFPTIESLAHANEQDVLAQWSGLGYYRRAKNLHRAAQQVVDEHDGNVPSDVESLLRLPGIGRYTAGSIASIAFDKPEPIVDGNVVRVLLRIEGADLPPTETATMKLLWERAETLVKSADSPAAFNEGTMELGATICTPRSPSCEECPVRTRCKAKKQGRQGEIPMPKPKPKQRIVHAACVVIRDKQGRLLIEQRDDSGMWAGLWQAPTVESNDKSPSKAMIKVIAGGKQIKRLDSFEHQTSHRTFHFTIYAAAPPSRRKAHQHWATDAQIRALALARPQMRILLGDDGSG